MAVVRSPLAHMSMPHTMPLTATALASAAAGIDPASLTNTVSNSTANATANSSANANANAKRKAAAAGLPNRRPRTAKRRASKACQCCRSRKVRCNVVEHGAPCTNCRLDEVECIVAESKRKRKSWTKHSDEVDWHRGSLDSLAPHHDARSNSTSSDMAQTIEPMSISFDFENDGHAPHSLYQSHSPRGNALDSNAKLTAAISTRLAPLFGPEINMTDLRQPSYQNWALQSPLTGALPAYIKPLPPRIGSDEATYLERKNVLSIPDMPLRNELLRSYIEYVHPYMPILDLNEFMSMVDQPDGSNGKVSLLVFQAVMFTASAFVSMNHLRMAGFDSRREARKAYYQKARLLYDFDYELDRVAIVQSILLMTYWYEAPDDQKDTWHWMGVATSLAYTVGLHRDTSKSGMDVKRQKLWKRIWWSCIMRDRLIALGMRRPVRIKDNDYDVAMLSMDDFEFRALSDDVNCVSQDCLLARNTSLQRDVASMCIEMIKLCECMAHVLAAQYAVNNNNIGLQPEYGITRTTPILVPAKHDPESQAVKACHAELEKWFSALPGAAQLADAASNEKTQQLPFLTISKGLLHMVYHTTVSALHQPEIQAPSSESPSDFLAVSRNSVHVAAESITAIAKDLNQKNLVHLLPTSGVTTLLPAILKHLMNVKSTDKELREKSLDDLFQVLQVLYKMRDSYASADYSMAMIDSVLRKVNVKLPAWVTGEDPAAELTTLTPPASETHDGSTQPDRHEEDVMLTAKLGAFLASTPPHSDENADENEYKYEDEQDEYDPYHRPAIAIGHDFDQEFGALVDFGHGDSVGFEDGGLIPMQGESSGFAIEMDLMKNAALDRSRRDADFMLGLDRIGEDEDEDDAEM